MPCIKLFKKQTHTEKKNVNYCINNYSYLLSIHCRKVTFPTLNVLFEVTRIIDSHWQINYFILTVALYASILKFVLYLD